KASKRDGSILDFFTKKIKITTLFPTEEIELTEVSTISEDKTHESSSLIQNAPLVDLLNPSNINDLPENYDESENESEFFGNFDKSPNTNKQTSPQQTTNVSLSNRSTQIGIVLSKCDMHCCNSAKPYHPVTDDELALTTIDKRIRSTNDNYELFEDVLGLYELSQQNAEAIVKVIFDILTRCGLTIFDCRGQSYDGASSMNGIYGGVSDLVLKQQCKAFFVHCNAHCLDLAIHDLLMNVLQLVIVYYSQKT
ncbi:unnamed protein product, partial [Rotaria magnacalcarata]